MHVGYTGGFQNPGNRETDATVYEDELRLADLAVDLGFDSLWTVEHHFTDYFLSPDPVQYLTWMGARHPRPARNRGDRPAVARARAVCRTNRHA
jgi:hypothetical protein